MRVVTRGDFDGLASTVFLTSVEKVSEVRLVHPKEVQDGKVEITKNDIVVNLPYRASCGMWFHHHFVEGEDVPPARGFKGSYAKAPSAARVVYEFYRRPELARYEPMLREVDRVDSGQLIPADVTDPKGWVLLSYTIDPRTGFGEGYREYFLKLVEWVKRLTLEEVLAQPEVRPRIERVRRDQAAFARALQEHSRVEGNVVVTDFRGIKDLPVGNRFLVYTLFPSASVSVRIFDGRSREIAVVALGHSIFNRTCAVNLAALAAEFGGGGLPGAASIQLPKERLAVVDELIRRLRA